MLLHHAMKWGKKYERNNITDEGNEILLNLFSTYSHLGGRKKWSLWRGGSCREVLNKSQCMDCPSREKNVVVKERWLLVSGG